MKGHSWRAAWIQHAATQNMLSIGRYSVKPAFHDTDTDILVRILADTSDAGVIPVAS